MKLEFTESEMKSYLSSKGYYFTKQGVKTLNGIITKYVDVAYKGQPSPNLAPDEYYSTYGEPTETISNVFERFKDEMKSIITNYHINNSLVESGKEILRNLIIELNNFPKQIIDPQKYNFMVLFRQEHIKFELDAIIENIEPLKLNFAITLMENFILKNKQIV